VHTPRDHGGVYAAGVDIKEDSLGGLGENNEHDEPSKMIEHVSFNTKDDQL